MRNDGALICVCSKFLKQRDGKLLAIEKERRNGILEKNSIMSMN